ncbi:MAG: crossover junction endodeoxyribonuclease RuvC [Candidatus Bipolaricaulota bacterium]
MREWVTVGFDPGLATTGYGVVVGDAHDVRALAGGIIETASGLSRADRLRILSTEAGEILARYAPVGVAIEEVFFATNAQSAMRTAEARGALLVAAASIPVHGYTPLQVKKRMTGYGRATKAQVQAMVRRLLNLSEVPKPDDVADGLALALCCHLDLRAPGKADHVYL